MSRLPQHVSPSHAVLRERLFEAANEWFPDYDGPGGWDPASATSGAEAGVGLGVNAQGEDLGRGLLDAYALALHVLWTYQEAWADEGFLSRAQLDTSVERLLAQIGYQPGPGTAAIGLQHFRCVEGVTGTLPAGFRVASNARGDEPDAAYELLEALRLDPQMNELRAWAGPQSTPADTDGSGGSDSDGGADGTDGSSDGSRVPPGAASADVPRTAPVDEALQDRLSAGAGGDLAARDAARARVEVRRLSNVMKRLKEQGLDQCEGTRDALCQELCDLQKAAMASTAAPGPMSESQQIALRQLRKLAEQQQSAITALDAALARCEGELDEAYRKRLDAMAEFLDAFVAGLVQDARDRTVLLRGPRALARLDRALGDTAPSALGNAPPGTDNLFLVAVDGGRIVPQSFPTVRAGDWLVLAEDLERIDDEGRPSRRRVYREAVRVVSVNHERIAGFRSRFTRVRFQPRLRRRYRLDRVVLLGNNGLVSEGATVEESAALSLDGRTLTLTQGPLTWLRATRAAGGRRPECRVWINDDEWERRDALTTAGPSERVFAVEVSPGAGARLRFGDGRNGALVPSSAAIRIRYRIGIGTAGNRASLRIDQLVDAHPAAERTLNPLPLTGGTPPEDRSAAKIRAPAALRAMDRAVSLADVQALALTFDGVHRAEAARGLARGEIVVVAAGEGGAPLAAPADLREFLQARVAPGLRITLRQARTVSTFVEMLLKVAPGADPIAIMDTVRVRLGAEPAPAEPAAEPPGLLHPNRVTLDRDLHLSDVYAAVEDVDGLESCVVHKLYRGADHGNTTVTAAPQRTLTNVVRAAPDEVLVWAPPRDGVDGVRLAFEEALDR